MLDKLVSWLLRATMSAPAPPRVPPSPQPPRVEATPLAERRTVEQRLRNAEARLAALQAEAGLDELRSRREVRPHAE